MTNEEFQSIMLREFQQMRSDIGEIKEKVSGIEERISGIEADVAVLKTDVSNLKTDVAILKTDVSNLTGQMEETNQIVKAIRHQQEFANARLEGLELTTVKIESVQQMQQEVNVLGRKVYALAK